MWDLYSVFKIFWLQFLSNFWSICVQFFRSKSCIYLMKLFQFVRELMSSVKSYKYMNCKTVETSILNSKHFTKFFITFLFIVRAKKFQTYEVGTFSHVCFAIQGVYFPVILIEYC